MAWVAVAAAAVTTVGGALLGGGGSSAPAADPNVGAAAQANAAISADALNFNKQVYAENKPRQAAMDALSTKVVNDQLAISKQNQTQAADQWARFNDQFVPVENQTVKDAMTIDTPAEQERAAGEAGAQVTKSYDATQKQTARSLAGMGINPNSGKALATTASTDMAKAADTANAMTNARQLVKDKGVTLRAGVANFGRNMPNTAANAYGVALNSGNNAVSNQGAGATMANGNAGVMNQGFSTAINGNSSVMNGLNQQYGTQTNAWSAQQQADAASSAGVGKLAGSVFSTVYKSSKKLKNKTGSVDHADTLDKVKGMPVDAWKYKSGVADGGEHIGAYAEDVNANFGDKAAPGGKAIDIISMQGITLSAVKGLSKQVDQLEGKVAKLAARGIGRG